MALKVQKMSQLVSMHSSNNDLSVHLRSLFTYIQDPYSKIICIVVKLTFKQLPCIHISNNVMNLESGFPP